MPRRERCVLPGGACHITQRGVDGRETFLSAQDRATYLTLIHDNLGDAGVSLLGYCLMTNHVHLIAVPGREDSLAVLLRRVHGRYAQYFNALRGRTGHLWQNRFFACVLQRNHLWRALAYVERNPARAGIACAAEYRWSSAAAHTCWELTREDCWTWHGGGKKALRTGRRSLARRTKRRSRPYGDALTQESPLGTEPSSRSCRAGSAVIGRVAGRVKGRRRQPWPPATGLTSSRSLRSETEN